MSIPARTLVYLTTLPAVRVGDDAIVITRKFLEGMARYAELWDGLVRCVVPEAQGLTDNLDNVEVRKRDLPYDVHVMRPNERWEDQLAGSDLVMVSLGSEFTHLAAWCAERRVPLVFISELSWRTRLQIARASVENPVRLARRATWEIEQEFRYRKAVAHSAGIQCNGTPTFRAYQALSPDALLYFDSRSTESMIASDAQVQARLARAPTDNIRLAFSGRLVPIKGVDHLVPVAAALRGMSVGFSFRIFGAGSSEGAMRDSIAKHGLEGKVTLEGNLDFAAELTPCMRDEVDLFVCCHRQGDPSCTYLETMSCGVPVVGYANEAFAGLLEHVDGGRATPMDNVERLATAIASVARDRGTLLRWSENALVFARAHTFEKTFNRRIQHARRVSGQSWPR